MEEKGLHCLSAFSAFTTLTESILPSGNGGRVSIAFRRSPRSPQKVTYDTTDHAGRSPLPFGVLRVHHFDAGETVNPIEIVLVSIAFRRSPRSPPKSKLA